MCKLILSCLTTSQGGGGMRRTVKEQKKHFRTCKVTFPFSLCIKSLYLDTLKNGSSNSYCHCPKLPQTRHCRRSSLKFAGQSYVVKQQWFTGFLVFYRSLSLPRAYKDDVFKFRYPVITEKPEWWLRTLACVPYLLALQISDAGYFLHPFLEHYEMFENLIYFVPGAIKRLPPWFSMIYCYFGYIGIVKNKDWPHYIRFHLMMGMLLETALQLIWYTSNFLPLIHYNGCFGMHYWAGIGFGYILVLFECVRCALGGRYAHIPFISDAAYIHTVFNVGGFQQGFK
ncbi:hypothetical protein V6Z11_D04G174100 [Gossypium hirsutum]